MYHVSKEQLSLEKIYFSLIDREHAETECERYEQRTVRFNKERYSEHYIK